MKKLIAIFLTFVIVMSMVACSKAPNTEGASPTIPGISDSSHGSDDNNVVEDPNTTENKDEQTDSTDEDVNAGTSDGDNTAETTKPSSENSPSGGGPTDRDENDETNHGGSANAEEEKVHTHKYVKTVTQPTCENDGYTTNKCSCGDSYVDAKVTAKGHKFGQWITVKEPTTAETGLKERKCSNTNCTKKEQETIGKLIEQHTCKFASVVEKEATCTAEGVKRFTCSGCGSSYIESIGKKAHSYTKTTIKATCTTGGRDVYKCNNCTDSYVENVVNALDHSYKTTTVNPTCTSQGYTTYTCTRCSHTKTSDYVSTTGHSYSLTSDTATCASAGKKTYTCSECGVTKQEDSPKKNEHGKTREEKKEATTTEAGYVRTYCTVCNTKLTDVTIPKIEQAECEHLDWEYVDAADSTDPYMRKYTDWQVRQCKDCGYTLDGDEKLIYTQAEAAKLMLKWVNELREETFGTKAYNLELGTNTTAAAKRRAKELASYYGHTGYCENIAKDHTSLKQQFNAWKNSAGHLKNMLEKSYTHFGYGYYVDGFDDGIYGCMVFTQYDLIG